MRIAVNTLPVVPGITVSAETYTSSLVRSLLEVDSRNEYLLILRRDNGHIFPKEGKGVSHVVSPVGGRSRAARILWEQMVLPWVCKSRGVDLLVIPTGVGPMWVPCPSVVIVTLMLAFRMPESLPWLKRVYYRWSHSASIRQAGRVVALSEKGRQDIQRHLGLDASRIEVVYPGVPEEFRPGTPGSFSNSIAELAEVRDYILAVGPVQPYKNLDLLVGAFSMVRARGFPHRLVIASGGQAVPSSLRRLAEDSDMSGEVCFIERFLTREELVALYSGATVFVHPSSEEQFSLTVVEAMSCGAPVITSDLPSFREQVGDAGIVVEVGNRSHLCESICAVLSDPSRRKEMSRRSLERSHKFSWLDSARKMLAVFEGVVANEGRDAF